jgi:hypothetical protein
LYDPVADRDWDTLVESSCNGTFLHTRRFLSYHGCRFVDRSMLLHDGRGHLVGVLPIAEDPHDPTTVVSHPGITYGGIVHDGSLRGERFIEVLDLVARQLSDLGYRRFRYKTIPWIYHRSLACDDTYAFFRVQGQRSRCELTATLDVRQPGKPSHGRRTGLQLASRTGVAVYFGWEYITEFWHVLEANLADRYGAVPTHSLAEINHIHDLFPEETGLLVARVGTDIVAGALLFIATTVLHTQYLASTEEGRAASALDPVVNQAVDIARDRGCRFFDFGTSNTDQGWRLNQSLYDFKLSFGAGGAVHEEYELSLPSQTWP